MKGKLFPNAKRVLVLTEGGGVCFLSNNALGFKKRYRRFATLLNKKITNLHVHFKATTCLSRSTVSQEVTKERLSIDRRWRLICFLSDNGVVWKDAAASSGRHEGVNNEIIPTSILSCPLRRLP